MTHPNSIPTALAPGAHAPERAHHGDAGADLRAALGNLPPVRIPVGARRLIPTGVSLAVPHGWAALICSRSGLARDHGVAVANAPGVVDSGYRGEVGVVLENRGQGPYTVRNGDRVAQLVLVPVGLPEFSVVDAATLGDTDRGRGGFGSTGTGDAQ